MSKPCSFNHNQQQVILQTPKKLVRNDPFPCPQCKETIYITIERSPANNLLTSDLMWRLIITEKPLEEDGTVPS